MTKVFRFSFTVRAALSAVAGFHQDPRALRFLTPPPIFVRVHRADPLAEGAIADFTLWFGPLPIHWTAIHTRVDSLHGFTDTQTHGPMLRWVHTHTFAEEDTALTRITEHIEYDHYSGARGLLTRLLFTTAGLHANFCYRRWITRRRLEPKMPLSPRESK